MIKSINLFLFDFLAKLTPIQRFEAARELSYSPSISRWFLISAGFVIVILVVLFVMVTFYRRKYEVRISQSMFSDYAKQRGLSPKQKKLLFNIAGKAQVKRKEAIFNLPVEFERAVSRLITETLSSEGTEKAVALRKELFEIRRKLGFDTYFTKSDTLLKPSKLNSRQLKEGKEVYLTSLKNSSIENIKAIISENTEMELKIKPSVLIDTSPGKRWRITYNFGAGIWEFDTTVFSTEPGLIAFNHSSEIRYVNRRRFLRTRVNSPALIANFPFSRKVTVETGKGSKSSEENENPETGQPGTKTDNISPPDFFPATVTELAGPGLQIETDENVDIGQRLLVIFEMKEPQARKNPEDNDNEDANPDNSLVENVEVVEEVAEVKRVEVSSEGKMIVAELISFSDIELDKLVKVTNETALKNSAKDDKEDQQNNEEATSSVNV